MKTAMTANDTILYLESQETREDRKSVKKAMAQRANKPDHKPKSKRTRVGGKLIVTIN